MKGMLKAEIFRFCNSRSLWAILGVLVALAGLSIVTGTYTSAENTLFCLRGDTMLLLLSTAIYSGLLLADDFKNGMVRRYVAAGYQRSAIIASKFLHYLWGCTVLLFLYPLLPVVIAAMVRGMEGSFSALFQAMMGDFIKILPLYLGVSSLFFLIAILVQKGAVSMGASVAITILLTVFTNNLYGGGQLPAASVLKFSPMIQIQAVTKSSEIGSEYFVSAALSMALLAVCLLFSVIRLKREEL